MEEKNSTFKKLLKVTTIISALYGSVIALAQTMQKLSHKLEQKNTGQKKKTYINFMNGRSFSLENEEIETLSIYAFMGGVDLDLRKADLEDVTHINIYSMMSGVVIKVPPMVNVCMDNNITIMGGIANMVPKYKEEDLKTIVVHSTALMGGISIKMIPEEEEN